MDPSLQVTEQHRAKPAAPGPGGRVVLSRLPRGESVVWGRSLSVKFVLDGEERYLIGGRTHVVRPGQFLVVKTPAPMRALLPRAALGFCVSLPASFRPHSSFCPSGIVLPSGCGALGESIARTAGRAACDGESADLGGLFSALKEGLPALLEEQDALTGRIGAARDATRASLAERLTAARSHALAHRDRSVPVQEMAAAAGMSPFHFSRHFAEAFGESPAAFHQGARLALAAEILLAGGSVAKAAAEAGYPHPGSFARAFRTRFGMAPSRVAGAGPGEIEQILRKSGASPSQG